MRNRLSSPGGSCAGCSEHGFLCKPIIGDGPLPMAPRSKIPPPLTIENVRWRGRGWGIGAGLLGGAIIGGAIANSYYGGPYGPYYGGPGPYYAPAYGPGYYAPPPGDAIAYCMNTYRSYDPRSGTYLGYDGYRHACP